MSVNVHLPGKLDRKRVHISEAETVRLGELASQSCAEDLFLSLGGIFEIRAAYGLNVPAVGEIGQLDPSTRKDEPEVSDGEADGDPTQSANGLFEGFVRCHAGLVPVIRMIRTAGSAVGAVPYVKFTEGAKSGFPG